MQKESATPSIAGKICFYHAATVIEKDFPDGNENEDDVAIEKRLIKYIRQKVFAGKRNITIILKMQCEPDIADFNFEVSFKFNGRSNDFVSKVARLVEGYENWQEFEALGARDRLYLDQEHFDDVGYFDADNHAERLRAIERLAKIAMKDQFCVQCRIKPRTTVNLQALFREARIFLDSI